MSGGFKGLNSYPVIRSYAYHIDRHFFIWLFCRIILFKLKTGRYFSAAIPEELGGDGLGHREVCDILRIMAQYCGSRALAFSMHQHLLAAAIWKYKHKGESVTMLQKVANDQLVPLVPSKLKEFLYLMTGMYYIILIFP